MKSGARSVFYSLLFVALRIVTIVRDTFGGTPETAGEMCEYLWEDPPGWGYELEEFYVLCGFDRFGRGQFGYGPVNRRTFVALCEAGLLRRLKTRKEEIEKRVYKGHPSWDVHNVKLYRRIDD